MLNVSTLVPHFARMGARLRVDALQRSRWGRTPPYTLDVRRDNRGSYFELRVQPLLEEHLEVHVPNESPQTRHLLLMVRFESGRLHRFLCGHDERDWFAAAVPGNTSTVRQALVALEPPPVREAAVRAGLPTRKRHRRRNEAFQRQGEWFFIPAPDLVVDPRTVMHHEPIRRGGGKPHSCEEIHRRHGTTVYVSRSFPNGLTVSAYKEWRVRHPGTKERWTTMARDAEVYARGAVRHPDHRTLVLPGWHRVLPNTEHRAPSRPQLAFLD
jgi:hypothetical protein